MLEVLLWTALGLAGVTIGALAVPVDIVAHLEARKRLRLTLEIGWLFGLVRLRTSRGGKEPSAAPKPKPRKKKRQGRKPSPAVVRRGLGVFGDLLERVQIRRVELDLTLGTDDPASTGEMAGYAAPVVAMANALPRTRVSLTPDFSGPYFEGVGMGEIRVVPLTLVSPIAAFAFSPEVRRWFMNRH